MNQEQYDILKQGAKAWNEWRAENRKVKINLRCTELNATYLRSVDLSKANVSNAFVHGSIFTLAKLENTIFSNSILGITIFNLTAFKSFIGLETTVEVSQEYGIDLKTLQNSTPLPRTFLRKPGPPDTYIDYIPEFVEKPINFFPVFLSHSWSDKAFTRKIDKGIHAWFDEKRMYPRDKINGGISKGINTYDKLILVCSKASLNSWWVLEELERIKTKERKYQQEGGKQSLLILITIDNHIFESDSEYADTIRKYVIGDFRTWKDPNKFKKALNQLIEALNVNRPGKDPVAFL